MTFFFLSFMTLKFLKNTGHLFSRISLNLLLPNDSSYFDSGFTFGREYYIDDTESSEYHFWRHAILLNIVFFIVLFTFGCSESLLLRVSFL